MAEKNFNFYKIYKTFKFYIMFNFLHNILNLKYYENMVGTQYIYNVLSNKTKKLKLLVLFENNSFKIKKIYNTNTLINMFLL